VSLPYDERAIETTTIALAAAILVSVACAYVHLALALPVGGLVLAVIGLRRRGHRAAAAMPGSSDRWLIAPVFHCVSAPVFSLPRAAAT
jgi:hypothetical protein